jgi:hypothetical protein
LHFTHNGSGSATALIPTQAENNGSEPLSLAEARLGKAVNDPDYELRFDFWNSSQDAKVALVDAAGNTSQAVTIRKYISCHRYGCGAKIPISALAFASSESLKTVTDVKFFVDSTVPAMDFEFEITALRFSKNPYY